MSLCQAIPSYVYLDVYRTQVMVSYAGQQRTFRLCRDYDHMAAECSKRGQARRLAGGATAIDEQEDLVHGRQGDGGHGQLWSEETEAPVVELELELTTTTSPTLLVVQQACREDQVTVEVVEFNATIALVLQTMFPSTDGVSPAVLLASPELISVVAEWQEAAVSAGEAGGGMLTPGGGGGSPCGHPGHEHGEGRWDEESGSTILFDDQKRAVGVRFDHREKARTVLAKREVEVSARSIGSPHLLMLLGIGPAQHLTDHGIPVLVDLPGVGSNLQDHPAVVGLSWTVKPGSASSLLAFINPADTRNYIQNRQGPLTNPLAVEGYAWNLAEEGDPYWPEFQYILLSGTPAANAGLALTDLPDFSRDFFHRYFGPIKVKQGFTILPVLLREKSRGTVRLRSGDPHESALIDPNFLSHPDDVASLIRGVARM
nr:oxygen-dependent choline dehydrogenase-like [Cherax quadricarinatus]